MSFSTPLLKRVRPGIRDAGMLWEEGHNIGGDGFESKLSKTSYISEFSLPGREYKEAFRDFFMILESGSSLWNRTLSSLSLPSISRRRLEFLSNSVEKGMGTAGSTERREERKQKPTAEWGIQSLTSKSSGCAPTKKVIFIPSHANWAQPRQMPLYARLFPGHSPSSQWA